MSIGIIEMALGSNKESASLPVPEAQVMTLREVFARYDAGCPFEPGDLVTPRKGYGNGGEGRPHIVLCTARPPAPMTWPSDPSDTGSPMFGRRLDMRVAGLDGRATMTAWWVESWEYEAWTGEGPANG